MGFGAPNVRVEVGDSNVRSTGSAVRWVEAGFVLSLVFPGKMSAPSYARVVADQLKFDYRRAVEVAQGAGAYLLERWRKH